VKGDSIRGRRRRRGRQGKKATTTGWQGSAEDIKALLIRFVNHRFPEGSVFLDSGHKLFSGYNFQEMIEGKAGRVTQSMD